MAQSRTGDKCKSTTLFGGDEGWSEDDWVAVNDSVRGGNSESYFDFEKDEARFHGILDIETLGGAGFASQRTTGSDREWDLSDYAGIQLKVAKGDKKRYTLIVKDTLPSDDSTNSRDKSTISWECDFELPPQDKPDETCDKTVFIGWDAFNPTYRGKVQKDVDPLETKSIKRFSLMMRSYFGSQEGKFSITIKSIKAVCEPPSSDEDTTIRDPHIKEADVGQLEKGLGGTGEAEQSSPDILLPKGSPRTIIKLRTVHALIAAAVLFAVYHCICR